MKQCKVKEGKKIKFYPQDGATKQNVDAKREFKFSIKVEHWPLKPMKNNLKSKLKTQPKLRAFQMFVQFDSLND